MIDGIVDLDREWHYVEPGDDTGDVVHVIMSEGEILRRYWPYWSQKLRDLGREHLMTPRNCVDDFVVVNFAEEVIQRYGGKTK